MTTKLKLTLLSKFGCTFHRALILK
ncbi:hypothetical protein LINGRAPRIM_LOCUS629 [Linum grandiflorum]